MRRGALLKLRELIISEICLIRVIIGSGSFWFWLVQVGSNEKSLPNLERFGKLF